jgi:hypothetical protein
MEKNNPTFTSLSHTPFSPKYISGSDGQPITTKYFNPLEPNVTDPPPFLEVNTGVIPISSRTFTFQCNLDMNPDKTNEGYQTVASIPLPISGLDKNFPVTTIAIKYAYSSFSSATSAKPSTALFEHIFPIKKVDFEDENWGQGTGYDNFGYFPYSFDLSGTPFPPANVGTIHINEFGIGGTYLEYLNLNGAPPTSRFAGNVSSVLDYYWGSVTYTVGISSLLSVGTGGSSYNIFNAAAASNIMDISFYVSPLPVAPLNSQVCILKGYVEFF